MTPPWEDPRRVLARHGLAPKRRFSQNFLVARPHAEHIAALATAPGLPVLEFGPGLGTLTSLLLDRAPRVMAVDADPAMLEVLRAELGSDPKLSLLLGDAVTHDITATATTWGNGEVVAAGNLPYSVTGGIFRNLCAHAPAVHSAVVMVQREVRDRLVASPGTKAYGALTVFVQDRFRARAAIELSAGCFHPPPKVASSVVVLSRGDGGAAQPRAFERVVRAAFQARRKTLRNALSAIGGPAGAAQAALAASAIDGGRRGETLSVAEFRSLAEAWSVHGAGDPSGDLQTP